MGKDMTRFVKRKPLREVLVEQGLVAGPQLDAVLGKLEDGRRPLGQALVAEGLLSAEQLGRALAAQYGLSYEPLTEYRVDPRFYQTIPVELMYRHPFVPLAEQDGLLIVAIHDPGNLPALDELELLLKRPLRLVVSTKDAILAVLTRSEGSSQALKDIEADYRPILLREDERGDEVLSIEKIAKDQSPVVKLVDTIILNALQRRASDIHVEASDRAVQVKYRIDGILTPALDPLDLKLHAPLISRIKVMSELDIAERRVPQDGRFRIRLDRKTVDFRVSILPSAFGEVVVVRILDKEYIAAGVAALRLDRFGFKAEGLRPVQSALTGHLVFTTVHANNAFDVIGRFVNMGIEPYNFVSSLNCILAQRLVRTICPACREEVRLDRAQAEESELNYDQYREVPLSQGRGCEHCHGTGYRGRQCITEFLDLTDEIKEMILDRKPPSEIRKRAVSLSMTSLRQAAVEKLRAGVTTLAEINRVTFIEQV